MLITNKNHILWEEIKMKKQSIIKTTGLVVACACLLAGAPSTAPQQQVTVEAAQSTITKEEAKAIVLKDAGVESSAIQKYKAKLEGKKKKKEYEIRFYSGDFKYEYELNALVIVFPSILIPSF